MFNTLCGLILATQVNACRVTLDQATKPYQQVLTAKAAKLMLDLEKELPKYSNYVIITGKAVYEGQIVLKHENFSLLIKQDRIIGGWKCTF